MFTQGMIMVVTGIGGLAITILLGIIQVISSKNKSKLLQAAYENDSETSDIIGKSSDSHNYIQAIDKADSTDLLSKESTGLLGEESTELLKESESTVLLKESEDETALLKDVQKTIQ